MHRFPVALSAVTMALVVLASPAAARPALVSAEPAQASVSARVNAVKLTFSEPVLAEASGMELVMTEMPGMAGHHHLHHRCQQPASDSLQHAADDQQGGRLSNAA